VVRCIVADVTGHTNLLARSREIEIAPGEGAIGWLGQSSFVLGFQGATVLVDPFLTQHPDRLVPPPSGPEEAAGVDLVAITHDHLDHLDRESLPGIAAASPAACFLVPRPLAGEVGVAAERVVGLSPGESAEVAELRVHAVAALHGDMPADAYSFDGAAADGEYRFLGYVFEGEGVRVYHAGDTIPYDGLAGEVRALTPDVALLPINGRDAEREALGIVGNLDEREAVELAAAAGVDLLVPMHWDMFAANPGSPAVAADAARQHPALAVLVPGRDRLFIYRRAV
jgi:L-ascorbate metabolism protein UlaG (beta-lactamase superfamily)